MRLMNPVRLAQKLWRSMSVLPQGGSCLPTKTLRRNCFAVQLRHGSTSRPFEAKIGDYDWAALTYDDFAYLFGDIFLKQPVRLPKFAGDRPFIIDAGAHVGFSCLYFKLCQPTARILCFEPATSCFQLLERNIRHNRIEGVDLVHAACGRNQGEITLFLPQDQSLANSSHKQWDGAHATEKARVVRLSDYIDQRVDLLKMNVEGAEWEIMDDLISTGKLRQVDNLMVAYHHRMTSPEVRLAEFLRLFQENGYVYQLSAPFNPQDAYGDKWQSVDIFAWRPS